MVVRDVDAGTVLVDGNSIREFDGANETKLVQDAAAVLVEHHDVVNLTLGNDHVATMIDCQSPRVLEHHRTKLAHEDALTGEDLHLSTH